MFDMPMNRHQTWGDRQAEAARVKNLEKLRKLAESAIAEPQTAAQPEKAAAPASKKESKAAKPAAKAAAKKSKAAPAKTKKKATKK